MKNRHRVISALAFALVSATAFQPLLARDPAPTPMTDPASVKADAAIKKGLD